MTPGDGVRFKLNTSNLSNVATKYRFIIKTEDDATLLFSCLDLKVKNETLSFDKQYHGLKKLQTKWFSAAALQDLGTFNFDLMMPLTAGNKYQNLSGDLTITLEAVQGNAVTIDEEVEEEIDGVIGSLSDFNVLNSGGSYALTDDIKPGTGNIILNSAEEITLDLNGHDIDSNGRRMFLQSDTSIINTSDYESIYDNLNGDLAIVPASNGIELNVKNISIKSNVIGIISFGTQNTINVEKCNFKCNNTGILNQSDSNVYNVKDSTFNAPTSYYSMASENSPDYNNSGSAKFENCDMGYIQIMDSSELELENTKVNHTSAAITTNGTKSVNSNLVFKNSEIISDSLGGYIAACESVLIENSSFYGGSSSGLEVRAGAVTIKGNSVFKTDCNYYEVVRHPGGSTTSGAGLSIAAHTPGYPLSLNIENGSFYGCVGLSIANPFEKEEQVSYTIAKGNFYGTKAGIINLDSRATISENQNITCNKVPDNETFTYGWYLNDETGNPLETIDKSITRQSGTYNYIIQ